MEKNIIKTYCFLAFTITWTIVLVLYFLYKSAYLTFEQLNVYYALGSLGPAIAAFFSSWLYYKKQGLTNLLATLSMTRIEIKSFLVAISPILLFAIGFLTYPLFYGKPYSFEATKEQFNLESMSSYVSWMLPFVSYAIFEELGWRGFLLPHLQDKYSAFKATSMLTLIWALWHIPFFLFRLQFTWFISIGFFFGLFVGAIIMTFIFNQSQGSLLTAILFHLTNNFASAFDKEYIVSFIGVGFVIIAIIIIKRYKMLNLSEHSRQKNYFITGG